MAVLALGIGLYLEYQKDSSFTSIDTGSILIGGGVALFAAAML
jgi:hypothetical protein